MFNYQIFNSHKSNNAVKEFLVEQQINTIKEVETMNGFDYRKSLISKLIDINKFTDIDASSMSDEQIMDKILSSKAQQNGVAKQFLVDMKIRTPSEIGNMSETDYRNTLITKLMETRNLSLDDAASMNNTEIVNEIGNVSLYNVYKNRESAVYMGNGIALTRLLDGHKAYVSTSDKSLAPHLIMDGYFSSWIYNTIMRNISAGNTVVDAGANVGYMTMGMARYVQQEGTVLAYEPGVQNYNILKNNIDINGYLEHVMVINYGLYNEEKELQFVEDMESSGCSHVYTHDADKEAHHKKSARDSKVDLGESNTENLIKIQVTTLDASLKSMNITNVDFIKIDVEGSDCHVLEGASETIKNSDNIKILMEWSPDFIENHNYDLAKCTDLIYDVYGFEVNEVLDNEKLVPIEKETFKELTDNNHWMDLLMYKSGVQEQLEDIAGSDLILESTHSTDL